MKHVLLITYYFPPYTGIEGNRLNSWANSLQKAGFRVTVLTRQWEKNGQNNWEDYYMEYHEEDELIETIHENYRVIRLPYRWTKAFRKSRGKWGAVYYWWNKLVGVFHPETNAYSTFLDYADEFLRKEKTDIIIVSSPPLNIIRLGYELKQKHPVKYIADFRDSYNNQLIQEKPRLSLKEKAESFFFGSYVRKWLKNADGIVCVSTPILHTIRKEFPFPAIIVRNGYEADLFKDVPLHPDGTVFTLSMIGSLYPTQDIGFMARAIKLLLDKIKPKDVRVQFIGIKGRSDVISEIKKHIDERYLFFSERIDRRKALEIMRNSHLLMQVGWKGYKGLCPGKVFEYLGAGRNILVAPADGDLTDRVIRETKTGFSAETIEEAAGYIEEKYLEWKRNGSISYSGDPEVISQYTRESQNKKLVDFLDRL